MTKSTGIQVDRITHRFGSFEAVSDVSLEVAPGEIHCLLGASGSGKSTLLRIIAGLERLQQGTVTVNGELISGNGTHQPAEQRSVGMVFQDYALFPHLTAIKNVLFGMPNRRSAESRAKAEQLLSDIGLAANIHSMPHTLSGGEQQRVALARALARTPSVMLLDEPFSGLDVQLRSGVRNAALKVLRSANVATILVTHDPVEAVSSADRVSVMSNGRIIQTDTPDRIYRHPADETSANTFGLVNQIPFEVRDRELITRFGTRSLENESPPETLFVRPEDIELSIGGDDPNAHIESVTHEAMTTLYRVKSNDSELYVRTLPSQKIPVEKPVRITLRTIERG